MNDLNLEAIPGTVFLFLVLPAFLLGFIASRVFEWLELSGARLRRRMALGEMKQATANALAKARELEQFVALADHTAAAIDKRQHERARIARELADAAGIGRDEDWLGKTEPVEPERGA